MPPIPIFSNAPINPQTAAAKADGVTPQTTSDDPQQQQERQPLVTPTRTTATTTAPAFDPSAPPPPQPGAAPVPPSTNQQPPYQPPPLTSQYSSSSSSPPAPQPGAAPVPAPTGTSSSSPHGSLTKTVTETVTMLGGPPAQFGIPPPGANAAPTRSTEAATSANSPAQHGAGPTTINFGAADGGGDDTYTARARGSSTASLEHPPGYVQNQYPDGTAAQRAALEAAAAREKEEGGVWGTVRGLAATVGEQLKKADQEAWKLVGGTGK